MRTRANPVYCGVDTIDLAQATRLIQSIAGGPRPAVGGIKLGLEFFLAHGAPGVRYAFPTPVRATGVGFFLDLKLHDIPNTVGKAMQALSVLEPAIVTVHAAGGRAMMEDAKAAAPLGTKVVAVTMLTSLDSADLSSIGIKDEVSTQVERLTDLAREAGLDGVVCSGAEVKAAKKIWPGGFFVVPGVRPADGVIGDQKRVVTPRQALDRGASVLVIGRPITKAEDPDTAARAIEATL